MDTLGADRYQLQRVIRDYDDVPPGWYQHEGEEEHVNCDFDILGKHRIFGLLFELSCGARSRTII